MCFVCCRMKKFGIPCPHVQVLKKHVLVMSFIGKDGKAAPKLKDVKLSPEDMQDAFEQTVEVRPCFTVCSLGK